MPRHLFLAAFALSILMSAGRIEGAQPVARVLETKGKVVVLDVRANRREAAPLDTIYAGQKMTLAADASITLAFRADGHLERVAQPGEVTVGKLGCEPKTSVEIVDVPERHKKLVSTTVQKLRPTGETGATIVRGVLTGDPSRQISPLPNSTILGTPVKFAWPAVPGATRYKIVIDSFDDKTKTSFATTQTQLDCADATVLKPGAGYEWEVLAASGDGALSHAYSGSFTLATEEQKARATELKALAAPDCKIAYLTLAATWYEENNLVPEALEAYQRLVAMLPNTAAYHFALSRLYRQADFAEESQKAYQRARQLQPLTEKPPIQDWLRKK